MTFPEALEAVFSYLKLARIGWDNSYIFIQESFFLHDRAFEACICIKTAGGKTQAGWVPSQADMLAMDWEIVA